MKHSKLVGFSVLAVFSFFSFSVLRAEDLCLKKIPSDFQKQILEKFVDDRLPTMADLKKDDIEQNRKQGGDGCLLVAVGDYDGNKQDDVALIMFSKKGKQLRFVVGLKEKETWKIESLSTWNGEKDNPYVQTLVPGNYERSKSLEEPVKEPGELASFSSKLTGLVYGTIEASGCAYFFSEGKWVHVWITD